MKFRVKECTEKQIKKRSETIIGWVDEMTEMIGTTFEGVICHDGNIIVDSHTCRWKFKPKWVEKVED